MYELKENSEPIFDEIMNEVLRVKGITNENETDDNNEENDETQR